MALSEHFAEKRNSLKPMALPPLPKRPLVSVLMSNYNYGRYLGDAIESVLGQTYDNLELIICDDGSTDSSLSILQRYEATDSRIKLIRQPNGGQSLALNAVFRRSAGQIICLLDADDVFMRDKVRLVVDALVGSPDSGLVVNAMRLVDAARNHVGEIPFLHQLPAGWNGPRFQLRAPQFLAAIPPSSGLSLHRSVADAVFPLPRVLTANSDGVIQLLAPMMTRIVALRTPLSEYRIHGQNTVAVAKFDGNRLRQLDVWHKEIWRIWRSYVASAFECAGQKAWLPPADVQTPMTYAYARFRSDPQSESVFRAIPRAYFETMPRLYRGFWQASRWMPNWLFCRSFAFVYGQTRARWMMSRIVGARLRRHSRRT